jgi:hypothetical protein
MHEFDQFPKIIASEDGSRDGWSRPFTMTLMQPPVDGGNKVQLHPFQGLARSDGTLIAWSHITSPDEARATMEWKLHPDNDGTFILRNTKYYSRCVWVQDGVMEVGRPLVFDSGACGARFSTRFCTRGCHWIPRMFASMAFLSGVHSSYRLALEIVSKH